MSDDEYIARCPACGDPIDYCQGHGEIGDPAGRAILDAHDEGDHSGCHPDGCDEAGPCVWCGHAKSQHDCCPLRCTGCGMAFTYHGFDGRDPIEVYGTPEHEAWLVEMERQEG